MNARHRPVALLQLPVPDPDPEQRNANVPLAAGCLKAAAEAAGQAAPPEASIHLPPRELVNHGGEQGLLAWLEQGAFDLVGFTTYLWNLERSLWLARALRERRPGVRVVFGGPEIVAGQPVLASPHVDSFVLGEGEPTFLRLLRELAAGAGLARTYAGEKPADLRALPNPYLWGALAMRPDEPLYLETMRGCPYRCSYCFYGKQYTTVRSYPAALLPELFGRARAAAVPEIYFMDPSFNAAPGLPGRLGRIAGLNSTRIPLHTEIRLEVVDRAVARLLADAGFRSVEVGLQSTNPKALREIRRSWNRERFLRGAELLKRHGVQARIGIIVGLPWDGLEELDATLSFLIDHDLTEGLEVYPLSVLPGTTLRARAQQLQIRFMDLPPYWVLSTNRLAEGGVPEALRLVEERLDAELFPPMVPALHDPAPGLTGYLDLRTPGSTRGLLRRRPHLGSSVTVHVSGSQLARSSELAALEEAAGWLRSTHPYALVQLLVEAEQIPPWEPVRRLSERFRNPAHILERTRSLEPDLQGSFSCRAYHVTGDPAVARRYYRQPVPFELLLRFSPRLLTSGRDILAEHPLLLVDAALTPGESDRLAGLYGGFEALIVRAPAARRPSGAGRSSRTAPRRER
jgi:hypothetical protein